MKINNNDDNTHRTAPYTEIQQSGSGDAQPTRSRLTPSFEFPPDLSLPLPHPHVSVHSGTTDGTGEFQRTMHLGGSPPFPIPAARTLYPQPQNHPNYIADSAHPFDDQLGRSSVGDRGSFRSSNLHDVAMPWQHNPYPVESASAYRLSRLEEGRRESTEQSYGFPPAAYHREPTSRSNSAATPLSGGSSSDNAYKYRYPPIIPHLGHHSGGESFVPSTGPSPYIPQEVTVTRASSESLHHSSEPLPQLPHHLSTLCHDFEAGPADGATSRGDLEDSTAGLSQPVPTPIQSSSKPTSDIDSNPGDSRPATLTLELPQPTFSFESLSTDTLASSTPTLDSTDTASTPTVETIAMPTAGGDEPTPRELDLPLPVAPLGAPVPAAEDLFNDMEDLQASSTPKEDREETPSETGRGSESVDFGNVVSPPDAMEEHDELDSEPEDVAESKKRRLTDEGRRALHKEFDAVDQLFVDVATKTGFSVEQVTEVWISRHSRRHEGVNHWNYYCSSWFPDHMLEECRRLHPGAPDGAFL